MQSVFIINVLFFNKKLVYKKPSTRHPKIEDAFRITRKDWNFNRKVQLDYKLEYKSHEFQERVKKL